MNDTKKDTRSLWLKVFFFVYIILLIKGIVFKYSFAEMQEIVHSWQKDVIWEGLETANFEPFKTIKMYIQYYDLPGLRSFENLFGNVIAFVPMGLFLPRVHKGSENTFIFIINVFVFVLGIEVFQLFSAFGAFDVDDIILNGLGAILGRFIYQIYTTDSKNLPS